MTHKHRYPAGWALTGLFILLAFSFQGARGLYEPDEGRYVNVALEMQRTGDMLVPHRHAETPHLTKPPLTYWALTGSLTALGRTETAARFPNAVAFVLTGLMVYVIALRLTPMRAWLAPLLYATSLMPFAAANIVTTDTLLTFWETLAAAFFVTAWWNANPHQSRHLFIGMWGAFGLAFATKGPPGMLPLAAFLPFIALTGRAREWRRAFPLPGMALFMVTGLSWYAAVVMTDPQRLHYFLYDEVFNRVVSGAHHRNPQWYGAVMVYAPTLLLGSLPWGGLVLRNGRHVLDRLRRLIDPQFRQSHPEMVFVASWILAPLAVFTIARSRLPLYVLPTFAPLSLATAMLTSRLTFNRRVWSLAACWVIVLLSLKAFTGYAWASHKDCRPLAKAIQSAMPYHPEEVVFVDTTAVYGLSFYLDCEVECVSSSEDAVLEAHYDSSLAEELAEAESRRVWIVKKPRADPVRQCLVQAGIPIVRSLEQGPYVILIPD